jgi:hypothetical protein
VPNPTSNAIGRTLALANGGAYTVAAVALNMAMACNPTAQAAYLATWGTAWAPLPTGTTTYGPTTYAGTVR